MVMMEPKITLELTIGEATALRELLQVATQARGLQVAEAALHLNKKLTDAVSIPPNQETEDVRVRSNSGSGLS
jgi:hypothetical protein